MLRKYSDSVRRLPLVALAMALVILLPTTYTEGDDFVPSGIWVASPSDICVGEERVCADWIDSQYGRMGSCCIPTEYLGKDAPNACVGVAGWYGLRLAGVD